MGRVINSVPKRKLRQVSSKITVKNEKFGKFCARGYKTRVGIKSVESHLVGGNRINQDFKICHHASLMDVVCVF